MLDRKARAKLLAWYVFFGLAWTVPVPSDRAQRFNYSWSFRVTHGRARHSPEAPHWGRLSRHSKLRFSRFRFARLRNSRRGTGKFGDFGKNPIAGGTPIPAGAALAPFYAAASAAGGGTLVLSTQGTYTLDVTALPAVVENVRTTSLTVPGDDLSEGAVISVTKASHTDDANVFQECEFDHVAWTSSDTTANAGLFKGYTGENLNVHDCLFYDFAPSIEYKGSGFFRFERNRVLTSGSPPANVNSNILYHAGSLYCQWNEFNFVANTGNGTGVNIIVGTSGVPSQTKTFKEWWVVGNRFLDADQANFTTDACVDLEAGAASTIMRNIRVELNTVYNGHIYVNSGDWVGVRRNTCVLTSNFSGGATNTGRGVGTPINIISTGTQADGDLYIEDNDILQLSTDTTNVPYQGIKAVINPSARRYRIRGNTIILNGAAKDPGAGQGAIHVDTSTGLSGTVLDCLEVVGNDVGYTAAPATPRPVIALNAGTVGVTINRARILGNRVRGAAVATEYLPATVGGTVASNMMVVGAGTFTLAYLEFMDNTGEEVTFGTSFFAYTGTITATLPAKFRGNRPAVTPAVLTLPASGSAYTNADHVEEVVYIGQDLTNSITSIQYTPANSAGGGYTLTQNLGGFFVLAPGDALTVTFVTTKPLAHKQVVP